MAATKRTVASTSDSQGVSGGKEKGKRSRHSKDTEQEQSDGVSVHASGNRPSYALNSNINSEHIRFIISPTPLLPIIQLLSGFEWPCSLRDDLEGRDKSRFC